jgi:hypothetical protein
MQERAKVIAIHDRLVSVMPLDIDACAGCSNAECKKNGNVFEVMNGNGLDISVGSEVRVAASARNQLVQALFSIGLPFALAVAAYIAAGALVPAWGEGGAVGSALVAFACGALLVARFRRVHARDLPVIVEIL